jgi:hypothetical protein
MYPCVFGNDEIKEITLVQFVIYHVLFEWIVNLLIIWINGFNWLRIKNGIKHKIDLFLKQLFRTILCSIFLIYIFPLSVCEFVSSKILIYFNCSAPYSLKVNMLESTHTFVFCPLFIAVHVCFHLVAVLYYLFK